VARLIASFFGTGLILRRVRGRDIGSGTVASLFALAVAIAARPLGVPFQIGLMMTASIACLIAVRPFLLTEGDPAWVVIDEAAGTFLATLGLGPVPALVAWAVFRLADIFKRRFPGVAAAEAKLPGAVGVLADDLVAGLYGLAAGWLLQGLL
jgi:phosphatidylglycerophosphatase A